MTKRIDIMFSVEVPIEASEEQIRDWVEFGLYQNSIQTANPLSKWDLKASGHVTIKGAA